MEQIFPQIKFIEILSMTGLFFADIFTIFSLIGSFLILLIGIINFIAKKKVLKTTENLAKWSIIGLLTGTLTTYALFATKNTNPVGIILHTDQTTIALLLLASLLMLFLRILIEIIKKLITAH